MASRRIRRTAIASVVVLAPVLRVTADENPFVYHKDPPIVVRRDITVPKAGQKGQGKGVRSGQRAGSPWAIAHQALPQIQTCELAAFGSSSHDFAM